MDELPVEAFTPADVLRRVAAMGVIANVVTLWSYLRARLTEEFPDRAAAARPTDLPIDEDTLADWLDDFVDTAEVQRAKLSRHLNPGSRE